MKLERVEIESYRAIEKLDLPLDPALTVFHGANGHGKTSVLGAIAAGLGSIPILLPEVSGVGFLKTDRCGQRPLRVMLRTRDGIEWERRVLGQQGTASRRTSIRRRMLKEKIEAIVAADREGASPIDLPIVAFYDTDRAVFDAPHRRRSFKTEFPRYAALEGALAPRPNFREFFKWFYAMENEELREKKERRDWDYQLKELIAVRTAIERMVPGVSDPDLAGYRCQAGAHASWEGYRRPAGQRRYRTLVEDLADLQHGLCGYCEIDLRERGRQVEHVIPVSAPVQGSAPASTMPAPAGSKPWDMLSRSLPPARTGE